MTFKNKIIFFFFCVLLQSSLSIAHAKEKEVDYFKQYEECTDKEFPVDDAVIKKCSAYVSDEVLLQMDKVYADIFMKLKKTKIPSKEQIKQFKSSQEAWIKYRDDYCELEGYFF